MKTIEVTAIWSSQKAAEEIEKFESMGIDINTEPEEEKDLLTLIVEHIVAFYPTTDPNRTKIYVVTAGEFVLDIPYDDFRMKYLEAISG